MEGYDENGDPLVQGVVTGTAVMVGTGELGKITLTSKMLEKAMADTVLWCSQQDPPITDPDEVRAKMMEARERVKKSVREFNRPQEASR